MRFIHLRLKGYLRIYNGMKGLDEINIDFTKCKNKIVRLNGRNGSGKSTIEDALTFFPESPSEIVDNVPGEKYISAIMNNDIYEACFTYPITNGGKRGQTKASFKKNGIELNPNGNISSYKELLETEFNMDPNFVSLSYLSSMNRGFADKTPAERKRCISTSLSSLDTYNNMNKILTKRSSVFKSHINTLSAKISSIGDLETIDVQLKGIDDRIKQLENIRIGIEKQISKQEANIELLDPGAKIQDIYNDIVLNIKSINSNIESITSELQKLYDQFPILNDLDLLSSIKNTEEQITKNRTLIDELKNKISYNNSNIESLRKENDEYLSKKINLESETNIKMITESLKEYTELVNKQDEIFNMMNVIDFSITEEEVIKVLDILDKIKISIDNLRANYYHDDIVAVCNNWGYYTLSNLQLIIDQKTQKEESITDLKNGIQFYNDCKRKVDLLKNRPENCVDSKCFFIQESLKAKDEEPEKNLKLLEDSLKQEELNLLDIENELKNMKSSISTKEQIEIILNYINSNKVELSKFSTTSNLINIDRFLNCLGNGYQFDEIKDSSIYLKYTGLIKNYEINVKTLNQLKKDYDRLSSKEEVLELLIDNISKTNDKINTLIEDNRVLNNQISLKEDIIKDNNDRLDLINKVMGLQMRLDEEKRKKSELSLKFSEIKESIKEIDNCSQTIVNLNSQLQNLLNELNPIKEERERIKYNQSLLQDYTHEYNEYNKKYEVINFLKDCCSPSKDSIQTIFMKIYMSKTISLTNELLKLFFDGGIYITNYNISDGEFSIPCVIDGLPRNDISSGSNAQTSIMSMIISFVLMIQASEKYNIIRLDEIDGSLDIYNRPIFVDTLNKLIDALDIEQVIIISHSTELDSLGVDNICLSGTDDINGNIIYS